MLTAMRRAPGAGAAVLAGLLGLAACQSGGGDAVLAGRGATTTAAPAPPLSAAAEVPPPAGTGDAAPAAPPLTRPPWLGTRLLPLTPDGYGEVQPTPPELQDRALPTVDFLPAPADGDYASTVAPVPAGVVARSTWVPACPVALADLRYLTVSFWGFDGRPHTGELVIHADVAADVVEVFRRLHEIRFPIEEMRVTSPEELDAHPTGDGNNTSAFVCRPSRGSASWSEHASGTAIDVNPFHNPYLAGDLVLPELASAYADRSQARTGMILPGDAVTSAFADAGWGWGGTWRTSKDYMHFSVSGR